MELNGLNGTTYLNFSSKCTYLLQQ